VRTAVVVQTPELLVHDLDGNLVRDGRWEYSWDAENRLVRVMSWGNLDGRRVDWTYDALGRRVRQVRYVWTNSTWQVVEDLKLVSDPGLFGRHIAELNGTNGAVVRSYVWGLDLSESLDGAGGVGGLLWVRLNTSPASGVHFVTYDGNGNVWTLVSASTGTETARYEYGPFGEPLRLTGAAAGSNPLRFSTKRTEDGTGLVLYEYSAYSPTLGRWLSRDPMVERGGLNLCGFVRNNPINVIEYLGLKCTEAIGKNGRPRIVFDPSPPNGGWKISGLYFTMNPEDDTYDGIAMMFGLELTWSASVAVLCKCSDGCYHIKRGTRVSEATVQYEFFAYQAGAMPITIPTPTTLIELIGEGIAAVLDAYLPRPMSIRPEDLRALASRVRATKPKNPWDGKWKGGRSPCQEAN
jgi:RHS repeat-associated protein